MKALRPLTPKEFSEAIHGLESADTVRGKCKTGEYATVKGPGRPPYFIRPEEVLKWKPMIADYLITV